MSRLTARIVRLEKTHYGPRAGDKFAYLKGAELDARTCQAGERLTLQLRESGKSVDDLATELGRPIKNRLVAALRIELAAPAFDGARYLASLKG